MNDNENCDYVFEIINRLSEQSSPYISGYLLWIIKYLANDDALKIKDAIEQCDKFFNKKHIERDMKNMKCKTCDKIEKVPDNLELDWILCNECAEMEFINKHKSKNQKLIKFKAYLEEFPENKPTKYYYEGHNK